MKIAGIVVAAVGIYAAAIAIAAWWLMLLVGAVHLDVVSAVPSLGYWQSVLVVLLISSIGAAFNSSASVSRSRNK